MKRLNAVDNVVFMRASADMIGSAMAMHAYRMRLQSRLQQELEMKAAVAVAMYTHDRDQSGIHVNRGKD